jgi:O-antigen/teichoic acid export membrane protein
VALVGGELVTRLYGDAYGGQQTVVAVLAVGVLAKAIGMTARQGLWVIGQPALRFRTDVLGVVVTFATATILIREWGSLGVAVGMLAGHVAAGSLQWVMFALRLKGPPAPVDGDLPRRAPSLVAP